MNTKTKNMLQHLEEHAENGHAEAKTKTLISKLNLDKLNLEKLKQPKVLWAAAGVAALIGAGVAWRLMRNNTKTSAH